MAIAILSANQAPSKGEVSHPTTIPLFGSRKLERHGRAWYLVCHSEQPQPLTERESMFLNAAIRTVGAA
ncbi:MAG TPA: hypothetical protein VF450_14790 [Noviherbaspirillum sp.]